MKLSTIDIDWEKVHWPDPAALQWTQHNQFEVMAGIKPLFPCLVRGALDYSVAQYAQAVVDRIRAVDGPGLGHSQSAAPTIVLRYLLLDYSNKYLWKIHTAPGCWGFYLRNEDGAAIDVYYDCAGGHYPDHPLEYQPDTIADGSQCWDLLRKLVG